jgi:hypothetical protein
LAARYSCALLARPVERVHARVDDEAAGAPDFVRQAAEALIGRVVDPHFLAEFLAVERPALAESVRKKIQPEDRQGR